MRESVRLSSDTLKLIRKLGEIYSIEFGNLPLSQSHIVNKAYYLIANSHESIFEIDWLAVRDKPIEDLDIEVNSSGGDSLNGGIIAFNFSEEIIEGIKIMQGKELRDRFDVKRLNRGFCIKLIVKFALIEALEKLNR